MPVDIRGARWTVWQKLGTRGVINSLARVVQEIRRRESKISSGDESLDRGFIQSRRGWEGKENLGPTGGRGR